MANVHGFVYSQNGYPKHPFRYAYSVGFGIAYPWAKAMREPRTRDER